MEQSLLSVEFWESTFFTALCVGALLLFALYYLIGVPKRPTIAANEKYSSFLLRYCPVLREKYWPTFWCFGARTQTLFTLAFRSCPTVEFKRELVRTKDGGQIGLDWQNPSVSSEDTARTTPIVVIIPGIIGGSCDNYIQHLVRIAADVGYRAVVVNHRGRAGVELLTARLYSATNIEDFCLALQHIKTSYPQAPLIGTGVSYGAIILSQYLCKTGADCGLQAGMLIVVPWDPFACNISMSRPLNFYLFNRWILMDFLDLVQRNKRLFSQAPWFDDEAVLSCQSTADFDAAFTSRQFGYRSRDEYYREAQVTQLIPQIPVPLLCLNAADDVFSPGHAIPMKEAERSQRVAIVRTDYGGHAGFLEGLFPRNDSYMHRLYKQYIKSVVQHREELQEAMEQPQPEEEEKTPSSA